jgi:hypothetical protein
MAEHLPPSSADVTESESCNLPETSGPHRPVMGLLYLYLFMKCVSYLPVTFFHNSRCKDAVWYVRFEAFSSTSPSASPAKFSFKCDRR